jgi:hypothetical protein
VPQTAPEHWYAPHDVAAPALHTPAPLQVDAVFTVEFAQPAGTQTVPAANLRHAPAPSQKPSSPQVEAADAEHSVRGFVPGSANLHVPRLSVAAQVWQVPPQALLQQTPSMQKPLVQSPAPPHAVPFASCGTQWPAAQWLPAVQSLFEPHVDAHAVAPHMYAPQDAAVAAWQVPAPSQARAGV